MSSLDTCPLPLELRSRPPPSRLEAITEHRAELPALHGSFPLANDFAHSSVYMLVLLAQFIPPSYLIFFKAVFNNRLTIALTNEPLVLTIPWGEAAASLCVCMLNCSAVSLSLRPHGL